MSVPAASRGPTKGKVRRFAKLTRTVSSSMARAASGPVPCWATIRSRASSSMSTQCAMNPPSPGAAPSNRWLSAAAQPPHEPWPIPTTSGTSSCVTANSSAAETPWRPASFSNGGTRLATLRTTKISPGDTSKICAGSTRLSEQAITITLGLWPADNSAQRSRWRRQSPERKR